MITRSLGLTGLLVVLGLLLWARQADTGAADTTLSYVALGDSITAAEYSGDGGFVSRYGDFLAADLQASVITDNLGITGAKSGDLLEALRNSQAFRDDIASADVVTVFIGMADFAMPALTYGAGNCGGADNEDCLRNAVEQFRANWLAILDEIAALNDNPNLVLRLCDNYSAGTGDPAAPYTILLLPYLLQINEIIHSEATGRDLEVASVFAAFNAVDGSENPFAKGYIRDDHIHPSAAGFDAIANALRTTGYAPLAPSRAPGVRRPSLA